MSWHTAWIYCIWSHLYTSLTKTDVEQKWVRRRDYCVNMRARVINSGESGSVLHFFANTTFQSEFCCPGWIQREQNRERKKKGGSVRKNTSLVAQFWTPSRWGVKLARSQIVCLGITSYMNIFTTTYQFIHCKWQGRWTGSEWQKSLDWSDLGD